MKIETLIEQLIWQGQRAGPEQVEQIIRHVAAAPFTPELLEVDEALWGGFWQLDVIAPGYRLPAVELALLRAMRLEGRWPEGTNVAEFLADLQAAVIHPLAGVWSLVAAGAPCLVVAGPAKALTPEPIDEAVVAGPAKASTPGPTPETEVEPGAELFLGEEAALATVVWYCAVTGRLHGGYRTESWPRLPGAVEQRPPGFGLASPASPPHVWQGKLAEESQASLAVRLDAEIRRLRG
jgi:hypothetical protein